MDNSLGILRNHVMPYRGVRCDSLGVVLNEQGFPHHGWMWVKKLVHRTNSRTYNGTKHKIDIENNRRYHRRRPIRKEQDRRWIRVGT